MVRKFSENPALRFFVGDVRDESRLDFAMRGIDFVFHAAALKQVVTAEYNPTEFLHTNIIGAENVAKVAIRNKVKKVMGISTDKAVKPVNLYGATKACMEKVFVAANHLAGADGTRFGVVRYGNVIGSRGSVVSVFKKQKEEGKRITITDPRMTRFWLRIEDGVKFAWDCAQMMRGGECFVKKLPSMRVTDLAEAMAPGVAVETIGIRPGEKLHESMVSEEESFMTYEYDNLYIVQPAVKMWDSDRSIDYQRETGRKVAEGFSYASNSNKHFLTVKDLRKLLDSTDVVSE
jgi:UDP-N-acetylglucosamine 4,6-dehydratase